MANREERERFWNVLCGAHDNTLATSRMIAAAIPRWSTLCRFRSVNRDSLLELQSNRLLFSSADHYDDPFDTYLRIDHKMVADFAIGLSSAAQRGAIDEIWQSHSDKVLPPSLSDVVNYVLGHASQDVPDSSYFAEELDSVRTDILKKYYSICFCDDPLNESLWLKYADSHRGFVQVYEPEDTNALCCGRTDACKSCVFGTNPPSVYPVYYSDEEYDATLYSVALRMLRDIPTDMRFRFPWLVKAAENSTAWEFERVSLIKKRCHEYDGEWRMICPYPLQERPGIGMKPSYIVLGLKMPEYERRLVISAALVAQVTSIREAYIDASNNLSIREVDYSSDLLLGRWARTTDHI